MFYDILFSKRAPAVNLELYHFSNNNNNNNNKNNKTPNIHLIWIIWWSKKKTRKTSKCECVDTLDEFLWIHSNSFSCCQSFRQPIFFCRFALVAKQFIEFLEGNQKRTSTIKALLIQCAVGSHISVMYWGNDVGTKLQTITAQQTLSYNLLIENLDIHSKKKTTSLLGLM